VSFSTVPGSCARSRASPSSGSRLMVLGISHPLSAARGEETLAQREGNANALSPPS
jgi:hypothetical protein